MFYGAPIVCGDDFMSVFVLECISLVCVLSCFAILTRKKDQTDLHFCHSD